MQKKKITVVPYQSSWPKIFEEHASELKKALRQNCIHIYHIGSTSVPGLYAKPVIDIMCVVKDLQEAKILLEKLGYIYKGEFNLPLRLFFSRKFPINVHIHLVTENNGEIEWQLCFQNYLRKNEDARNRYAKTKLNLIKQNPDGFDIIKKKLFSEYTVKKGNIILEIAKEAGFSGYRFVIATNENELIAFKKLLNIDPISSQESYFNLCLYNGTNITSAALLEIEENQKNAYINKIVSLNDQDKSILLKKIKEWMNFKNINLII